MKTSDLVISVIAIGGISALVYFVLKSGALSEIDFNLDAEPKNLSQAEMQARASAAGSTNPVDYGLTVHTEAEKAANRKRYCQESRHFDGKQTTLNACMESLKKGGCFDWPDGANWAASWNAVVAKQYGKGIPNYCN